METRRSQESLAATESNSAFCRKVKSVVSNGLSGQIREYFRREKAVVLLYLLLKVSF